MSLLLTMRLVPFIYNKSHPPYPRAITSFLPSFPISFLYSPFLLWFVSAACLVTTVMKLTPQERILCKDKGNYFPFRSMGITATPVEAGPWLIEWFFFFELVNKTLGQAQASGLWVWKQQVLGDPAEGRCQQFLAHRTVFGAELNLNGTIDEGLHDARGVRGLDSHREWRIYWNSNNAVLKIRVV